MLRNFTAVKIQWLRPGLNPQTWVPEVGQRGPKLYRTQKCVVIFFFRMDSIHLTACICYEMCGIIVNNYRTTWLWSTVGSNFEAVRFTMIHFYDPCRVGLSTPQLVVHNCRNSSVLPLISALMALSRCAYVSSYFSAVRLSWLWFFHPWRPSKRLKKFKTVDLTFFLDVFWTTAWAFFNKIKSDLIDIFFNYLFNFLYT